ncbi:WD40-repeat-containing domain protein [Cokeromyces recurvatus]|uniref:WD40-repeat-containing domain protein n=1 Tax=Cokeromyces recurvatus TaxID=90255 RepID=UPI00221F7735|nr:WD40-repeat-containing domain protein [Cokeromyces recurvatus]KAI7905198.1 WD40-repeat-containing domain protein [Cokeromyces recurvatus]
MKSVRNDNSDEGYIEQKFEDPSFIKDWSDDQKAELAYQILSCIPVSKTIQIINRLLPIIHIDYISKLPYEIAIKILSFLDVTALNNLNRVSKYWKLLSEDHMLWKSLFYSSGWTVNSSSMNRYLCCKTLPSTTNRMIGSSDQLLYNDEQSSLRLQHQQSHRETVSQTIVERPLYLLHKRYHHDEAPIYHYDEQKDIRFINWKRLYRNRFIIDQRWKEGKSKLRQFPNSDNGLQQQVLNHNSGIYCLQFNTKILVTGSRDKNIKIWNIKTGQLLHKLKGHEGSVLCLQFNEYYLISGSSDSTLIVWDIHTGQRIKTLIGHRESVLNVKFHKNRIVSCSKDRTIRAWDLEKGESIGLFRGHRAAVNAVQFKDQIIVSASGDRTIKVWDMSTGECLRTLDSHSRGIACVEYDGNMIVSGSSDQTIKVWNAMTGECLYTLVGHTDLVRTLQLDNKLKIIVSGSYDGTLKIWQLEDGSLIKTLNQISFGRILNLQFDFSKIVCCSNLGQIVIWDFTYDIDSQFLL